MSCMLSSAIEPPTDKR